MTQEVIDKLMLEMRQQESLIDDITRARKVERKVLLDMKYVLLDLLFCIKKGDHVTNDGVEYVVVGISYWKDYTQRPVLAGKVVLSSGVVDKVKSTGAGWEKKR